MINTTMEIFPGIDIHVYSREDITERYIIKIINHKILVANKPKERIITLEATISEVYKVIQKIIELKNEIYNLKK